MERDRREQSESLDRHRFRKIAASDHTRFPAANRIRRIALNLFQRDFAHELVAHDLANL